MSKLGTVRFKGKSGSRYRFDVYPLEAVLDKGLGGVYVVTERKRSKTKPGFCHVRMSAGHSGDLAASLTNGEKAFSARGANCFCVHLQKDEAARLSVEQDLLRKRPGSSRTTDQTQTP